MRNFTWPVYSKMWGCIWFKMFGWLIEIAIKTNSWTEGKIAWIPGKKYYRFLNITISKHRGDE